MNTRLVPLIVAYPNMYIGDGIFSDLSELDVPWKESTTASYLDVMYASHSGEKNSAPVVKIFSKNSTTNEYEALDSTHRALLSNVVYSQYIDKWVKLWNVETLDYDPVTNYDMVENETIIKDIGVSGSDTGTITNTGTDTVVHSGTDTVTHTGTDTVAHSGTIGVSSSGGNDSKLYGFNSSEGMNSNSSVASSSSTQTNNNTDTDTKNLTDTDTKNLTDTDTKNLTETHNLANSQTVDDDTVRGLTRKGNIGVTTTQQMLESEIALWNWNYFVTVMRDIDSILCLDIY